MRAKTLVLLLVFLVLGGCAPSLKGKISILPDPDPSARGRLVIKFSYETPQAVKEDFFSALKIKPLRFNVFGFDVGECLLPPEKYPNVKKQYEKYLNSKKLNAKKYRLLHYEWEYPFRKSAPLPRKDFLPADNKLFPRWFDDLIGIGAAHKFLADKKISLKPDGIVIADAIPDFSHPDIEPALQYISRKPVYWMPILKKPLNQSWDSHGTHVACLAAAYHNGRGVEGAAAPSAKILPLVVNFYDSSTGFYSDIAMGLAYFKQLEREKKISFRVVNMSFGFYYSSQIVYSAMQQMDDKLFVVAAGNSGDDNVPHNLDWEKNIFPAAWALSNKLAVAATDIKDELAYFSYFGKNTVDIAAPGKDILSCVNGGGYEKWQGTSMASPLVAGAAALLFSMKPDLTVEQAKALLVLGADALPPLKDKVKGGLRLNIYNSVRQLWALMQMKK